VDRPLAHTLKAAAWRACVLGLLLGAVVMFAGDALLRALLPALAVALVWVEPGFAIQHLDLVQTPAGSRVRTQVMLAHSLVVGQRVVMPHPLGQAFAWVPAWSAWQLPLLLTTALAAWPARRWVEWPWRLLGGLAVGLPLLLADLPVTIAAEFWRPLMAAHDPQGWQAHVAWAEFLRGGGRVWLALLAAAGVVVVARRLAGPALKRPSGFAELRAGGWRVWSRR
jgi:hypothetical protein